MPQDLPEYYAITAPLKADPFTPTPFSEQPACRDWLEKFGRLLDRGIELVQLRAKDLPPAQLEELARHCQGLAQERGIRLVLNGPAGLAKEIGMAGVHLTSKALMGSSRRPLPGEFLVGASCHSPQELQKAEAIGADFACLSPIRPVKGYDSEAALGFERFGEWVAECGIPVYGLGGLRHEDLPAVRNAGGQGVAGISAFWY